MSQGQSQPRGPPGLPPGQPPGHETPANLGLLAVAASLLLCWVFYRVRMRQCEAVLRELARALGEVRRTAEALQTRYKVVRAATATAEKALVEYNVFLGMLQQMQEGDGPSPKPDLPILRHQIELETMRAQVSMVQGCLLAMSQEVLDLGHRPAPLSANKQKQENILISLHRHRKSYMHMSEELLTLLDNECSGPESSLCS